MLARQFFNRILTLIVLFCLQAGAPLLAAGEEITSADGLTAEAAVDGYISNLLKQMEQLRPLYESDREGYFHAVEEALAAFVDFREVARGVMAKYGTGPNGATAEQMQRFSGVFKSSLVDFYGSALAGFKGASYEILPSRGEAKNPESSSNVRMSINSEDGSAYEVQYTMFLNGERIWKLKNLYVEGVNLRRQYYAQFDSLMNSNDFDIDKVIDLWQVSE